MLEEENQIDPKSPTPKSKFRRRLILGAMLLVVGIFAWYSFFYKPSQNVPPQSGSQPTIELLSQMTEKELQGEIDRLSVVARDYSARTGEYNTSFSACASGLAIMYQNELIMRELKNKSGK